MNAAVIDSAWSSVDGRRAGGGGGGGAGQ